MFQCEDTYGVAGDQSVPRQNTEYKVAKIKQRELIRVDDFAKRWTNQPCLRSFEGVAKLLYSLYTG